MRNLLKGQKGFTLIELLVVVAILGVLAAIAIPNVYGLIGSGNEAAAKAELATVQTAVDAYVATTTPTTAEIDAITVGPEATGTAGVLSFIRGGSTKGTYTVDSDGLVTQTATGF